MSSNLRHFLEFTLGNALGYLAAVAVGFPAWQAFVVASALVTGNALGRWLR
jgi:hypothetical protein